MTSSCKKINKQRLLGNQVCKFHYQVIFLFRLLPDVLNDSLKRNKTILFACGDERERKVCREENERSFRFGGDAEALMKEQNHSLLRFFLGCRTCLLQ